MEEVAVVDKRKRLEDGEINGKLKVMMKGGSKIKADDDDDDDDEKKKAVVVHDHEGDDDDGEVEEFFAILKRIRVAVKYFEKGDVGDGRRLESTMARSWNPSFEREDFEGFKVEKSCESVEENAVLDLNAHPADT